MRRLMRMSSAEIAHRLNEQAKRVIDRHTRRRWSDFGYFVGPLIGLPGVVEPRIDGLRAAVAREAPRIRQREFRLLGSAWPRTPDWDSLWHLDPLTGGRWPAAERFAFDTDYRHEREKGDVKFVWEVNRLQFLPVLALAGEHELLGEILRSWMAMNPPFRGINWASGIEAASRVVSVLAALAFVGADQKAKLDPDLRAFLGAHQFWIRRYPSLYSSANNHRVAELVAEFVAAICARDLPGAGLSRVRCRDGLEERIQHIFHDDGVGAEQSVTYASYALEWFALAGVAANGRFSDAYRTRAGLAADHLRALMDDGARTPAIGDGDETRVLALQQEPEKRYAASVVALVARWLDEPGPPATDPHLRDLWGSAGAGAASAIPEGVHVFEEGGISTFREQSPRGTLIGIFDHGPLGFESIAAHGHADALAFWFSWGEEAIVIDAGTYLYHSGGKWRDYFRGTPVHNTLAIEDANQSTIAGPFNWSHHAQARIVERSDHSVTAEHDGYRARFGLIHRRTVARRSPGRFVIEDRLLGTPRRSGLRWQVGFTLAAGIDIASSTDAVLLTSPGGRALRIAVERGPQSLDVRRTNHSPSFGQMRETDRITLSGVVARAGEPVAVLRIECPADG